jgi:hypothetical protein
LLLFARITGGTDGVLEFCTEGPILREVIRGLGYTA